MMRRSKRLARPETDVCPAYYRPHDQTLPWGVEGIMWRRKMKASKVVLFFILTATLRTGGDAQQTEIPAEMILTRASDYVSKYEADLGNLIGSEEYVQSSVWMDASVPPKVSKRV